MRFSPNWLRGSGAHGESTTVEALRGMSPSRSSRLVTHRVRSNRVEGGQASFVTEADADNVTEIPRRKYIYAFKRISREARTQISPNSSESHRRSSV